MPDDTKAPAKTRPFTETIEVAVGPNIDGQSAMATLAHTRAPDPEITHRTDTPLFLTPDAPDKEG